MNLGQTNLVIIPDEELSLIKSCLQDIQQQLTRLNGSKKADVLIKHITAKEFMDAVRIRRTKFDQLVQYNKIKVIKKRRKIYVPVGEVDRYFNDVGIQ